MFHFRSGARPGANEGGGEPPRQGDQRWHLFTTSPRTRLSSQRSFLPQRFVYNNSAWTDSRRKSPCDGLGAAWRLENRVWSPTSPPRRQDQLMGRDKSVTLEKRFQEARLARRGVLRRGESNATTACSGCDQELTMPRIRARRKRRDNPLTLTFRARLLLHRARSGEMPPCNHRCSRRCAEQPLRQPIAPPSSGTISFCTHGGGARLSRPVFSFPSLIRSPEILAFITRFLVGFPELALGRRHLWLHGRSRLGRKSTLVTTLLLIGLITVRHPLSADVCRKIRIGLRCCCRSCYVVCKASSRGEWGGAVLTTTCFALEYSHTASADLRKLAAGGRAARLSRLHRRGGAMPGSRRRPFSLLSLGLAHPFLPQCVLIAVGPLIRHAYSCDATSRRPQRRRTARRGRRSRNDRSIGVTCCDRGNAPSGNPAF